MTHAAAIVFWISVLMLIYTYAGYPCLVAILSRVRARPVRRDEQWEPAVSVIITAYNEQRDLARKLENTLALEYPREKLEIIVASDGSTDGTDEIARCYAAQGVRLHRQPERLGKTAAQNAAVERARGEVILFSDATTRYRADVLRAIIPSLADPRVGCVAGRLIYVDPARSNVGRGARLYWQYETWLKQCESRIGSLIGASGCMYATRRAAYVPLYEEACSDFLIATIMAERGLRTVFEPAAVCTEETHRQAAKELKMRVRIITQTFSDLWRHREMLNPVRSGFFAVQLFSHKVLRYAAPVFLLTTLAASLPLVRQGSFYTLVPLLHLSLYTAALGACTLERAGRRVAVLALPQYFMLGHLASLLAFYQFLRGERYARWETVRDAGAGESSAPLAAGSMQRPA